MKTWTKEERYRVLKHTDISDLERENKRIEKSRYRQNFHIQPLTGLLNDPNGFCFFNDCWHIFYQWFPFGAVHGLKYWYHLESKDLINWKNQGLALSPDTIYDNKGVYSGSAYIEDGRLNLIYTGNHRDEEDVRHPYQCIATLEDDGVGGRKFVKKSNPIISESKSYTEHQRDPRVVFDEKNKEYVLIIGAQNMDKKGRILVYKSKDIYTGWKEVGELKIRGYEDFGYMWECPDLIKLGDKYILVFSPQGLKPQGNRFNNIYQNGYLIGSIDFESLEFKVESDFKELDLGFDFYASQSSTQSILEEKSALIAWMGLPDSQYTTDDENWSGCLTLPRILSIEDGRLIQRPVDISGIKNERVVSGQMKKLSLEYAHPCSIKMDEISSSFELRLFSKEGELENSGFQISYDEGLKEFKIDRSKMEKKFNADYGLTRSMKMEGDLVSLEIFVDKSSVEIFINDGEYTMTSRVFPTEEESFISIDSKDFIKTNMWRIEDIRDRNFVV